ncbi:MAG: oleate hydratase, partial [Spirochaetales bacterium]|nr:oleate hydratase [Spirochaetales bacterium]
MFMENSKKHAYFVGGGLASLAGAIYLIRDGGFNGENIHILESLPILGGSNDGIGTPQKGFVCRGGRMLNEETYENFWELLESVPSIYRDGISVTKEILDFHHAHPTCAKARLINKDGVIQDVKSMGFNSKDRLTLLKLMATNEDKLDNLTIEEWFKDTPHFFTTNFWFMWQTTFAFQKWSSLFEFKRYMN